MAGRHLPSLSKGLSVNSWVYEDCAYLALEIAPVRDWLVHPLSYHAWHQEASSSCHRLSLAVPGFLVPLVRHLGPVIHVQDYGNVYEKVKDAENLARVRYTPVTRME